MGWALRAVLGLILSGAGRALQSQLPQLTRDLTAPACGFGDLGGAEQVPGLQPSPVGSSLDLHM